MNVSESTAFSNLLDWIRGEPHRLDGQPNTCPIGDVEFLARRAGKALQLRLSVPDPLACTQVIQLPEEPIEIHPLTLPIAQSHLRGIEITSVLEEAQELGYEITENEAEAITEEIAEITLRRTPQ